eukprot:CAMPEP_0175042158 /NCGR_PEP_ID=MMETSP0052_2-20121109/2380_1 /TAXON_ID=51329 ORGANISM="Polytomella parva, Strain SAG 63-3" /NCGR_SAMPLE_ID=MMETSP0052_2 /ASSEMBLY_ACC=CAM_ASM_000194 /LENGTH=288 /DNA_ID=CAMNT_0016304883 /DNA_START=320 /DNA_END=1186 /DNA_ORIENTATION=+
MKAISHGVHTVGASTNIKWQEGAVPTHQKENLLQQSGCVLWITGLSGSGKSTVACTLEHSLHGMGKLTSLLDGDNIRHGLNCNLGFSAEDREENIRRIGEVSKLISESGVITLVSFISPYRKDRDRIRSRLPSGRFIEIYMDVPITLCEQRDPKGLYKKARAGLIKGFTGIDDPYEPPLDPEIRLRAIRSDGSIRGPEEMVEYILNYLYDHGVVPRPPRSDSEDAVSEAVSLEMSIESNSHTSSSSSSNSIEGSLEGVTSSQVKKQGGEKARGKEGEEGEGQVKIDVD